jgi:hypothetical protein
VESCSLELYAVMKLIVCLRWAWAVHVVTYWYDVDANLVYNMLYNLQMDLLEIILHIDK